MFNKKTAFLIMLFSFKIAFSSELESSSLEIPYIWQDLRQTLPIDFLIKRKQNKALIQKVRNSYNIIQLLLNQKIFQDHFLARMQAESPKGETALDTQLKAQHFVSNLLRVLQEGTPLQIKNFMDEHSFTKSDKIIALVIIIFTNRFGEQILDLIDSLDLSVNDILKIKDINSLLIAEHLRADKGVITVLSHHLANTGNIPLLTKLLMETDYDASVKNLMNENILHTFIRLNMYRNIYKQPPLEHYREVLETLAEYSQKMLDEKDILGLTPLAEAFSLNDQTAVEVLIDKNQDLTTRDAFNRSLEDLASMHKDSRLILYLREKK